jgi:predicted HD superfamily hydrolase involved in NAD metabolism
MMVFSESQINSLRERVRASMSEWRFRHTAEVEIMVARLGELYAPDKLDVLRVAALLHDITKEKDVKTQLDILDQHGEDRSKWALESPKTLHAITAALILPEEFPEYATDEVVSAVKNHTTGAPDMSLLDMLVYLADYIDMSRDYKDCVTLREFFWDKEPENMSEQDRLRHLYGTVRLSLDMTLYGLLSDFSTISTATVETRNAILRRYDC